MRVNDINSQVLDVKFIKAYRVRRLIKAKPVSSVDKVNRFYHYQLPPLFAVTSYKRAPHWFKELVLLLTLSCLLITIVVYYLGFTGLEKISLKMITIFEK